MSSSRVVTGLNDDAIKFLKNGNYRAALWSLDMAMGRLRAGIQQSCDRDGDDVLFQVAGGPGGGRPNALKCFSSKTGNLVACAEELLSDVNSPRKSDSNSTRVQQWKDPFRFKGDDDDEDEDEGNCFYPTKCISIANHDMEERAFDQQQQISGVVFEFFPRAFLSESMGDRRDLKQRRRNRRSARETKKRSPTREFVILTYNMALVYHYEAICTGKASKYLVALNIYEMCLCFIDSMWNEVVQDDFLLLLLALYNNMGHAHSHLLNVEESQRSLLSVRDLILSSLESPEPILSEEDYRFFATTVVVFEGQECCCAPVA